MSLEPKLVRHRSISITEVFIRGVIVVGLRQESRYAGVVASGDSELSRSFLTS
jgi:hypothetical protein